MRQCLLILLLSGGGDSGTLPSKSSSMGRQHFHRFGSLHHLNGVLSHSQIPEIATEDLIHLAILGLKGCRALVEEEGQNPGSSVGQGFRISTNK
jgi:hypothetical protein